ncbi:Cationic amino acid transporter 4 [Pseudolycoriella hygida]|uniref:Cationic amino acid transporter 4 n=1 Tax=Pseudolycoriella hygida TaxID=35572 RepID=A0A9Q0NCS0_9DIPT|nr:Cationic amino acid transporter 4 [Pseudolycoriella hygida]
MPSTRKIILGHVMSGVCTKMNRTKKLPSDIMQTPLNRCLNTFDITLLGIGNMVGAGVYVLTGIVAKDVAGPAIVLSFVIAAMVSMLAALCYAEFGCRIPRAGSAYIYSYVSIGEFWAFVIGWNIILEHMLGAASVARAWSGYVDSMLDGFIANATISVTGEMHEHLLSKYPDFLAFFVCLGYTLALGTGVKTTAILNGTLTTLNVGVVLIVISVGLWHANPRNWSTDGGFLPFGFVGVISGAASCFYAFVGFDSIATSSEEILPSASIPLATILSLCIVTIIYVLVSAALTLMVPYNQINPIASLPSAFGSVDIPWAKYAISIGALCGMSTTLLGSLFALPRCLYAMASDGLLFSFFEKINPRTQVPIQNLIISGFCSASLALVFDLEKLVEFMSIGTLLAYTIVSASIIVLRYRPPSIEETITYAPDETPDEDDDSSQSSVSASSEMVEIALAGKLRPQYRWLEPLVGRCEPGTAVSIAVLLFTIMSVAVCLQFEVYWVHLYKGDWINLVTYGVLIFLMVACLIVITAHHQNCRGLQFKVPLVPLIPALSILFNIELMVHLSALTWLRLLIWLIIGMLVYFFYGIHHSKEGTLGTSYSMLLTTNENQKSYWSSTAKATINKMMGKVIKKSEDKCAIVEDNDET